VSGVLDLIASGEAISKDPYNSMNQGTPGGKISGSGVSTNIIGQNLTDMTIGEILSRAPNANDNAEERKQKGAVFAAGRYQIIPKTLQGLVDQGVVSKDEKFTPEVQDRLALKLVEQSGATKSINEGDLEKAQYQLSKVWASLPVPAGMMLKSGQVSTGVESFYGGANKAKEGLTLASLQLPSATPTMTVASARPATGPIVTAATAELEKERIQLASAPIVVTAPSVNVQQSQPNKMPQSINQPSVVDSEFMKLLVGRTVTI
jgi:muramidase (phage lysozyme)